MNSDNSYNKNTNLDNEKIKAFKNSNISSETSPSKAFKLGWDAAIDFIGSQNPLREILKKHDLNIQHLSNLSSLLETAIQESKTIQESVKRSI